MTILENLKLYNPEDDIAEAKQNLEGFDFTELDIEEITEAISPALTERDNWITFGPVSYCGVNRFKCKIETLGDGNMYPVCIIEISMYIPGQRALVFVELNPFECEEVRGDYVYSKAIAKVNKVFRKFMQEKFGKAYVEANNNY